MSSSERARRAIWRRDLAWAARSSLRLGEAALADNCAKQNSLLDGPCFRECYVIKYGVSSRSASNFLTATLMASLQPFLDGNSHVSSCLVFDLV